MTEEIMVTRKALRLINRLDSRAQDFAWMGGMHPDEHERIERLYHKARMDLARYISELEGHTK